MSKSDKRDGAWAGKRERRALDNENTGSQQKRQGAVFGRWLRGEVIKVGERQAQQRRR